MIAVESQIQEKIRGLRGAAREAKERDEKARELDDRIAVLEQELSQKRQERIDLEAAKRKIERLRPLRDRLEKIRQASGEAGDPDEIRTLPRDPEERLSALSKAIQARSEEVQQLQDKLDEVHEASACVTQEDEEVIEAAAEIRSLAKRAESVLVQMKRLGEARRTLSSLDIRIDERVSGLLAGAWNESVEQRIESLSRSELRQAMAAFEHAQSRYDELAAKRSARLEATEARVNLALRIGAGACMVIIVVAAVAVGVYDLAVSAAVVAFAFGYGPGRVTNTTVGAPQT